MRKPQQRLARAAQLGARGDHLGGREGCAKAAREDAEGSVGDARHRREEEGVAQDVRADLHYESP